MPRKACFIAILLACLPALTLPAFARASDPSSGVVVLADTQDPFYPLAAEIAQAEGARLADGWEAALQAGPEVMLWVGAPGYFSDAVMVAAGRALKAAREAPMVGIITGETPADARALWQRGQQARGDAISYASGEHPTAGATQAELADLTTGQIAPVPLTRESLSSVLPQVDYLVYSGHGSGRSLMLNPDQTFTAADLPDLSPLVVSAASCQTLRIWVEDSIALAFVQHGAAIYGGFVYSPIVGFMLDEYQNLPFRYSWPDFPIGVMAALENRGVMQGFAGLPFYFLLGDPRASLQDAPPYQILDDQAGGQGKRKLTYSSAPAGWIPVRVTGGAQYQHLEIAGVGSAADGDVFFNARIQTLAHGADRYILFKHPGGPFEIRLSLASPWYWGFSRPLGDALDYLLLFLPDNDGDQMQLAAGIVVFLVGLLRFRRTHRRLPRFLMWATVLGLLTAALQTAYQFLRLPHSAISLKPLAFYPLWPIGVFLLTAGSALVFWSARSWKGRVLGILLAALPALAPGLLVVVGITGFNLFAATQIPDAHIYNTHMGALPLVASIPLSLFYAAAFALAGRRLGPVENGALQAISLLPLL